MGSVGNSTSSKKLTDTEFTAVRTYVNMGNEINDLDKAKASTLNSTIDQKGNVLGKIDLYRAMSIKELGFRSEVEFRNNLQNIIGKEFHTNGFMSTAKTIEGTGGLYAPRTAIVNFTNTSIKGLDISKMSERADEKEVLFSKNAGYKITDAKINSDGSVKITASIIRRK